MAACSGPGGAPILANPTAARPSLPPPTRPPVAATDPLPVVLPRDDAAHDRLTEWWYYTGHLRDATGGRYGFEFVIFRAERGRFPTSWASHLAITDEDGDRFLYGQRVEVGPQVDRLATAAASASGTPAPAGFDLALTGVDAAAPTATVRPAWSMAGSGGTDTLVGRLRARRGGPGRFAGRARARPSPGGHQARGAPRPRRLDRLRAGRRLVLLLADGDGRGRDR